MEGGERERVSFEIGEGERWAAADEEGPGMQENGPSLGGVVAGGAKIGRTRSGACVASADEPSGGGEGVLLGGGGWGEGKQGRGTRKRRGGGVAFWGVGGDGGVGGGLCGGGCVGGGGVEAPYRLGGAAHIGGWAGAGWCYRGVVGAWGGSAAVGGGVVCFLGGGVYHGWVDFFCPSWPEGSRGGEGFVLVSRARV